MYSSASSYHYLSRYHNLCVSLACCHDEEERTTHPGVGANPAAPGAPVGSSLMTFFGLILDVHFKSIG